MSKQCSKCGKKLAFLENFGNDQRPLCSECAEENETKAQSDQNAPNQGCTEGKDLNNSNLSEIKSKNKNIQKSSSYEIGLFGAIRFLAILGAIITSIALAVVGLKILSTFEKGSIDTTTAAAYIACLLGLFIILTLISLVLLLLAIERNTRK